MLDFICLYICIFFSYLYEFINSFIFFIIYYIKNLYVCFHLITSRILLLHNIAGNRQF